MSLRVWLPLNGDLRNNGLDNIEVVNNGATVDNNGKIGKCYYFNGSNQIKISLPKNMNTIKNTSITAWIKSTGSIVALGGISYDNSTYGYSGAVTLYTSGWQFPASSGYKYVSGGSIANSQVWHHVACTIEEDKITTYLDGSIVKEGSLNTLTAVTTLDSTKNFIEIGQDSPGGDERLTGYVNDFRVYDHALSAKEVKELSKGLVCHYKLDGNGANSNLVPNQGIYTQNNPYILTTNRIDGYQWLSNSYFEVEPSTTYTFSVYCDAECSPKHATDGSEPNKFSMYLYLCNDGHESKASTGGYDSAVNCNSTNNNYKNFGQRHCWTYTTTSTQKYMSIRMNNYGAGTETITHKYWYFKVEKGDKLTTYIPNVNDELYSKLNYNSNIIYDSSGYNNHGEMWRYDSLGNIESYIDSPRNSSSTYINSENNTTNTASGTVYLYGNCPLTTPNYLTISFWCKPLGGYGGQTSQGQFCTTSNGIGVNAGADYSTTAMHNRDSYIDMCTSTNIHKTPTISFTKDEWHHYVIIYDGRYGKIYKDTIQTSSCDMGDNLSLASFKAIVIGFSKAGGVWRSNKSYYSDFRLYSTVLSEEDIKELYNIGASIDKNGNAFAYEFKED